MKRRFTKVNRPESKDRIVDVRVVGDEYYGKTAKGLSIHYKPSIFYNLPEITEEEFTSWANSELRKMTKKDIEKITA